MEILAGSLLTPETVNATDYPIAPAVLDLIVPRPDRKHIQVDQLDLAPHGGVSCFYASAFKICADAYDLTDDEKVKAMKAYHDGWANIVKDGKVTPGFGGRLSDGVDYARRAWNAAFPAKKVKTYRGDMPRYDVDSPLQQHFYRALFNGWMVQFGSFISPSIKAEILAGEIKDDAKPTDARTYGHARNIYLYENVEGGKGGTVKVLDNYPKTHPEANVYAMDDLEAKVQSGQVFSSFFLALPA